MTAAVQLDLFAPATEDRPLHLNPVCTGCGATCSIPVKGGAGPSWNEAVLFGYAAIKAHEKQGCPGQTPMARAARRRLIEVWSHDENTRSDTVRYADLRTSTWDARAALMLALGRELIEGVA